MPEDVGLLASSSVFKVDFAAIPGTELRKLVSSLRRTDAQLLAAKVETAEEFTHYAKLGLNLLRLAQRASVIPAVSPASAGSS